MPKAKPLTIDFSKEKIAGYRRVFSKSPLLTNLSVDWNGVYLAYDYQVSGEISEVAAKQHGVAIHTEVPVPIQAERTLDGCFRREQVVQGDILITPANVATRVQWKNAGGVIYLGFEPNKFARTIYEVVDPDRVQLLPHFATRDPLIYQIGIALKSALEQQGAGSRLYAESMANALSMHLLQHYSAQPPQLRECVEGLPKHKFRQVIDYIQAHLDCNLSLVELATLVQMSSHYFCQQFKQSTSMTPHQYVIHSRVERSKELLIQGELAITDVAREVGFVDQSHLTRHFKRLVGITPKTFRQHHKAGRIYHK
ncbi:MAG: helix-turn-helix transcriptional regulator [Chroococcidiopsidaceae cyanobacterium CP_BM_RX_35]|nr:helix-turn-helix transcriptional regulator [Chroococcidiopsidaceae cyanobacterium CP_BM_RX_35]